MWISFDVVVPNCLILFARRHYESTNSVPANSCCRATDAPTPRRPPLRRRSLAKQRLPTPFNPPETTEARSETQTASELSYVSPELCPPELCPGIMSRNYVSP